MAEVFVPLNSFKSVITNLTGEDDIVYTTPSGVSSILLSAQITNGSSQTQEVTIMVDSNRDVPLPQVASISNAGSFFSASALIELNKVFIQKETAAYIQFQNNLSDSRFSFTSSIYEQRVGNAADAIIYDITNGGTIRTNKASLAYYDKNGISLIADAAQVTASYNAINYANDLVQQILINENVTGSANVDRLYQTVYSQSYDTTLITEAGGAQLVSDLFDVIAQTIYDPVLIEKPRVELVKNFQIPSQDSFTPVIAGKLVLEERFGLVFSGSNSIGVVLSILESANE